jgi:hypothetical protein
MREHGDLQPANNQQHHVLGEDSLEIHRNAFDGGDDEHQDRHLVQNAGILMSEHSEGPVDQGRVQGSGAGHNEGGDDDERDAAAVEADMLTPEPADQRRR